MNIIIFLLVVGAYGFIGWKFWSGFENTNFARSFPNRLILSLAWPVLLIANKSYRQNFQKALKGSGR